MRFTKLSLFITGAVGILMLGVPRAAHAVAAALVQVANTASSPVISQSIGNQAAQIVEIECAYRPGGFPTQCVAVTASGITPYDVSVPPYVVPAGLTLVITAVDLLSGDASASIPACNSPALVPLATLPPGSSTAVTRKSWIVPAGLVADHYVYPSGILFPSGTFILGYGSDSGCPVTFDMHGYFTAQ